MQITELGKKVWSEIEVFFQIYSFSICLQISEANGSDLNYVW